MVDSSHFEKTLNAISLQRSTNFDEIWYDDAS